MNSLQILKNIHSIYEAVGSHPSFYSTLTCVFRFKDLKYDELFSIYGKTMLLQYIEENNWDLCNVSTVEFNIKWYVPNDKAHFMVKVFSIKALDNLEEIKYIVLDLIREADKVEVDKTLNTLKYLLEKNE